MVSSKPPSYIELRFINFKHSSPVTINFFIQEGDLKNLPQAVTGATGFDFLPFPPPCG